MVYAWANISARGTFRPRAKADISARDTKRVKAMHVKNTFNLFYIDVLTIITNYSYYPALQTKSWSIL
jgi:hypothetical protein